MDSHQSRLVGVARGVVLALAWHCLATATATAQVSPKSLSADAELLVSTGTTFIGIDASLTINDAGTVAFVGTLPDGSSAPYIATSSTNITALSTATSVSRVYNGGIISNALISGVLSGSTVVISRDRFAGSPPSFFVRAYNASTTPPSGIGFVGNSIVGNFDSATPFISINDNGGIAFTALTGGSTALTLFQSSVGNAFIGAPPTPVASFSTTSNLRPQLANDGTIIVRNDVNQIVAYNGGAISYVAAGGNFTSVAALPGISTDGQAVGFLGNDGSGMGIFANVPVHGTRQTLSVLRSSPTGIVSFSTADRIAITSVGNLNGDVPAAQTLRVVFVGQDGNGSCVFELEATVNLDDVVSGPYVETSNPICLVRYGESIGGKLLSNASLYSPISRGGNIAFWVSFSDGSQGILRFKGGPAVAFRSGTLFGRKPSNSSWIPGLAFEPTTLTIPGLDHLGLLSDGLVSESHPGYTPVGPYFDPQLNDSVSIASINGPQRQHTEGSFACATPAGVSPACFNVSDYRTVPILKSDAQLMEAFIATYLEGPANAVYPPLTNVFSQAQLVTFVDSQVQKGRSPNQFAGGGITFTCVGLIERAAEEAGVNGGQGYIPDALEETILPLPLRLTLGVDTLSFLSPQMMWVAMTHPVDLQSQNWITGFIDTIDFMVTDPSGNRFGYTGSTGLVREIPNVYYTGHGQLDQFLITNPAAGTYSVQLFGNGTNSTFVMASAGQEGAGFDGVLPSGQVQTLQYVVTAPSQTNVFVPNVVGIAQLAGASSITRAGLVLGSITTQVSPTAPSGTIISQNPIATMSVAPKSIVNLVVSSGAAGVAVPNVVGLTQAVASSSITSAGLTVGAVTAQSSNIVTAGLVISESPVAGTSVASGSAVSIAVSSGPAPLTVPNVVGLTQAAATTAITGAGLTLGTVTQQSSATVASGIVISESPTAGTSVAAKSAVNLIISSGAAPVSVPNVVGLTQAAATTALTGAGLTLGTVTTQSSSTVAAGLVISETPTAGTSVAAKSAVSLVVSSGAAPVSVPNVVGLTQAAATTSITAAGLTLGSVTTQSSPAIAAGLVISESPTAGTSVVAKSAVNLVVSSGAAPIAVPNVVGLTQAAATNAITTAGLTLGSVTTQSSSTVAAGLVISETPSAGTSVAAKSAVSLVVSSGAAPVLVPNVVGLTQAAATSALTTAGLTLGSVTTQSSSTVAAGLVISESPIAGTSVPSKSAVSLVVSSGAAPVAVPNVVGLTQAAATSAITGAGLILGTVTTQSSATVAAGVVISESPAAGTSVAAKSAVSLVVSSGAAPVAVPNVVGLTQAAATTAITSASLTLGAVTTQSSATVAAGVVISESPVAGTSVAVKSAVSLIVSTGSVPVSVPNVVGSTQAAATTAITNAGLVVGAVTNQSSSTVAAGIVISESPAAGTSVAAKSAVSLVVSTGSLLGDLNGDGVVNCTDLAIIKVSFGKKVGQAGFDARADVNKDGVVNVLDLSTEARLMPAGTSCN
jgi:beta-lactam-binding protein with PASTA domain